MIYKFNTIISINADDSQEAKKNLTFLLKSLDLKLEKIENIAQKRTLAQNNSLHLLFQQLSVECLDKGIEMRDIVRDEIPIECTPENLKWLWKKIQNALFKTKSTTELKRGGQIDIVYRNFASIISERTQGEIILPPFPSIQSMEEEAISNL